ncbi:ShlB/FhaC/HecB family hemolysin secretion/activation protein [Rahnella sp. PD12R]|uniref:ShlB/FhaC/HecB family hemolysin secretion/activation protein n=1 Tax=Rahnella sp. PD12R TaxID=2855688 RepID=UPI001C48C0F4|nr:ShlB/FhaC/HecB family hemolysin secretion/activation protein [Rahnella sp. PD12R]
MNVKFSFLAIVFAGFSVHAAPLSPADRDSIEQQQRGRLQQEQLQREDLERGQPLSAPVQKPAELNDAHCFTVSTITVSGAGHLPARKKDALTAPFIGKCLGIKNITQLVQEISDEYIRKGYITSRAYLPEQDLSQGQLNIRVMEGKLQDIQLDHRNDRMLAMAFPGLKGKILNLRDIEQGMEQINRLRQNPVQIEILPAEQPGFSVVNLTATPEFPITAGAGFDNSGQKSTGTGQMNGSLTASNVLGLADQWLVSGARSSDFSSSHDARSVQAGMSVPYGYWLLNYSYSYSDYLSTVSSRGFGWRSSGDSQTHRVNLSRVLFRNSDIKTGVSLGISNNMARNYLNDAPLASSSRKLSNVNVGINHSQKVFGGLSTLNPTFSRGVPWLGAENDQHKPADAPKAEFSKWSVSGSFYRPVSQKITFLSSAYGQWTGDRLYGSERLTIGGESSVRGFKEQYLSGDNGGYWRNELNTALFTAPLFGQITAVAAIDGGYLHHDNHDVNAAGTLWGGAVGLNSSARYFSSQFTVGWPLRYPGDLAPDRVAVYYRLNFVL